MIHILNKFTSNFDLQLALMERRVGDADKPLTIEKVSGEFCGFHGNFEERDPNG
jgi:hypothetical protein